MAELPKQINCPIKSDDGICMCAVKRCEWIDLDDCFRMRSAYFYGFNTAESIAINNLDRIKEQIDGLFKKIDEPKDGEQN